MKIATLIFAASTAVNACEYVEPIESDAAQHADPVFCSVDLVTGEPQDPCPEGQRCHHGSPPGIGWNVGECR